MITGKLYDRLKYLAQIVLPAVGTLYFAIAEIWGIAGAEKVVGTIMAIDLFLGALLGISQANYNKAIEQGGEVTVNDDQLLFQLDDDKTDIDQLKEDVKQGSKKEVRFRVKAPK